MAQFSPKKLKDQVMVITGASSGIGLATAKMAARKGAKIVLASRNTKELRKIVREIEADGGEAFAVTVDVAKESDMKRLAREAVQRFGRIDTWVNNAGVGIFGEILDTPIDEAKALFDTNFWGLHYGCVAAIEKMKEDGGVIVNLGSEVAERAVNLQAFYSASKHAIKGYNEGLRTEIESRGYPILFSLIRPAAIDTPFAAHAPNHLQKGEPSLPAPVYHPDVVAEGICAAAESGKRDVYTGGASKIVSLMNHITPRLLDYAVRGQAKDQMKGTLKGHAKENEGLLSAPANEGEMRGGHKGHVMRTSVYTKASIQPYVTGATLLGLAALTYTAFTNRPRD